MTKEHLKERDLGPRSLEQIFLDIDMSILASDSKTYKIYSQNVRQEYIHFEDQDFRKGRGAFLKGLIEKKIRIFKSDLFEELNEIAWKNIQNEIKELESGNEIIEEDL